MKFYVNNFPTQKLRPMSKTLSFFFFQYNPNRRAFKTVKSIVPGGAVLLLRNEPRLVSDSESAIHTQNTAGDQFTNAVCTVLTAPNRNILTYLLTYLQHVCIQHSQLFVMSLHSAARNYSRMQRGTSNVQCLVLFTTNMSNSLLF